MWKKILQPLYILLLSQQMVFASTLQTERHQRVEISLESTTAYHHPHRDVSVQGLFTGPAGERLTIHGYWDGDLRWKIRFAPPTIGEWRYRTTSSDTTNTNLHHVEGIIHVLPYTGTEPFALKGPLKVSENNRYLTYGDGDPFFWLGDTAWEITWKSFSVEAEGYFDDRQQKGFNVIQIVVMSHQFLDTFGVRNRAGEPFFLNEDFSMVNPRYFDYLDTLVTSANRRGMAVALVPLWAGMNILHKDERYQRFALDREASLLLARYTGARYAGHDVVWIVGGDNAYKTAEQQQFWTDFALELRQASGEQHLTSVHPKGWAASFDFFNNRTAWIDFHMYQSSHTAGGNFTYHAATRGFNLNPVRPVLNSEAVYEDIYHNLWLPGDAKDVSTFRIRPEHIRQANYESILSGALIGMTYGANGIWQWHKKDLPGTHAPRVTFDQAIQFPGSGQMTILKKIMEDHAWYRMKPARSVLHGVSPSGRYIPMAQNDQYLMVYLPIGILSVSLKPDLTVKRLDYLWINPSDGAALSARPVRQDHPILTFKPPDQSDWVLLISHESVYTSADGAEIPESINLHQNYPNPFNPETLILYNLPEPSHVSLAVYNPRGRLVRQLVDAFQDAGIHGVRWDGLTEVYKPAASGVYLYRLITKQQTKTRKMLLLK
ncbi:MAG: DUF4038 domain-containing protein [Gemmatimonadota bacterium]|nr:DUF4038 domain-containing protein [Gemmatimonadota bacterium]MEE2994068.1 DUF4038 domain-containing protein [Gemmatimonadota bacterium]